MTILSEANANHESSSTYTELPAQKYLAKMSNLPAVSAINGMVSSFPVIKIFTSNAVPILVARERKREQMQLQKMAELQQELMK
ncbi:hypothetical protein SBY92_000092 [Candida maltosa Xu316]